MKNVEMKVEGNILTNEPPRSKLRGIKDGKERSKLRGIYPERFN